MWTTTILQPELNKNLLFYRMGKGGVEPPLDCSNTALNRARLPIPPLAHTLTLPLKNFFATKKTGKADMEHAQSKPMRVPGIEPGTFRVSVECSTFTRPSIFKYFIYRPKCACQGSNLGPFEYQSNALPTELHAHSRN